MRLFLAAVLLLSSATFAQTSAGAPQRKVPVSNVEFDPDVVDGTTASPDLGNITARPPTQFDSLIRVRTSFADKLRASVSELR